MIMRMVQLMGRWSELVFQGHTQKVTPHVRALRLLEEVIELCQAEGVPSHQIDTVKHQVYSKSVGNVDAEFGGVMVCLMGYAHTREFNPEDAFFREFHRIMDPKMMEKVRNRNLSGDKIGMQ